MPALGSVNTRNFKTAKGRKPEYALQMRTADNARHRVVPNPQNGSDAFRSGVTRQSTSSGQNTVHAKEYTVPFLNFGAEPVDHTYFAVNSDSNQFDPTTDSIRVRIAIRLQRNDYWNGSTALSRFFSVVYSIDNAQQPYIHITPEIYVGDEQTNFIHAVWQTNALDFSSVVAQYSDARPVYDYAPILKPGALLYMEYMIGDPTSAYNTRFRIWSPDLRQDIFSGSGNYWQHTVDFTSDINNFSSGTISGPVGICIGGAAGSSAARGFDFLGAQVTRYRYDFTRGNGSLTVQSNSWLNNEFMGGKFSMPDTMRNNLRADPNHNHTTTDLFVIEANEFNYNGTFNKNKADFSVLSEYVDIDNPFRQDSDHNVISGQDVELLIYDPSQEMRDYIDSLPSGATYIHFKVSGRNKLGSAVVKYFYCLRSGGAGRTGRSGGANSLGGAGPYPTIPSTDHRFINLIRSGGSSGTMETLDRIFSIQFAEYNFADSISDDPRGPVWYASERDSSKHQFTGHNIPTRANRTWGVFSPTNNVFVSGAPVNDQRFAIRTKGIPGTDDVIVGSPFAPNGGELNAGEVYIYQDSGFRQTTRTTPDAVGGRANDYWGWAVTASREHTYISALNGERTSSVLNEGRVVLSTLNAFPQNQAFSPDFTANDQWGINVTVSPDNGILLVQTYGQNRIDVYTDGNHFDGTTNLDRLNSWNVVNPTRTHTNTGGGAVSAANRLGYFQDMHIKTCNTHYAYTDFSTNLVYVFDKAGNLAWSHDFSNDGTTNSNAAIDPSPVAIDMNDTYTLIANPAWSNEEGKIHVYSTQSGVQLYQSDNDPYAVRTQRWGQYIALSENGRYFATRQQSGPDATDTEYVFIVETQTGRIVDRIENPNTQSANALDGFGYQTVIKEYGRFTTEASVYIAAPYEDTNRGNAGYLYRFT